MFILCFCNVYFGFISRLNDRHFRRCRNKYLLFLTDLAIVYSLKWLIHTLFVKLLVRGPVTPCAPRSLWCQLFLPPKASH